MDLPSLDYTQRGHSFSIGLLGRNPVLKALLIQLKFNLFRRNDLTNELAVPQPRAHYRF